MQSSKPPLRIGEIHVCGGCLRTTFDRAELSAMRCRCGGRIVAMPRGEVDKRLTDRGRR